jgi:hypothetical protein
VQCRTLAAAWLTWEDMVGTGDPLRLLLFGVLPV